MINNSTAITFTLSLSLSCIYSVNLSAFSIPIITIRVCNLQFFRAQRKQIEFLLSAHTAQQSLLPFALPLPPSLCRSCRRCRSYRRSPHQQSVGFFLVVVVGLSHAHINSGSSHTHTHASIHRQTTNKHTNSRHAHRQKHAHLHTHTHTHTTTIKAKRGNEISFHTFCKMKQNNECEAQWKEQWKN